MFDFLTSKFSSIFSSITGKSTLTEKNMHEALEKVRQALLEADVPYDLVETFITEITQKALGQKVLQSLKPGEQLIKIVHEHLKTFLGGASPAEPVDSFSLSRSKLGAERGNDLEFSFQLPSTIMVMGLQGSGKTTSIAKMAYWAKEQAKKRNKTRSILCASVDFYRPAAVDQLEVMAGKAGVAFYRSPEVDPVKAAEDIHRFAKKQAYDLLFLDTAGRLHVDDQMLAELRAIDERLKPRYKIIALDAMTGQESLNVAESFGKSVGYHYAVLTKMDSGTRGGAAFSFRYAQKKPILFVGSGEKIIDLEFFHPDRMAGRILGMGDVLSLIEKVEVHVQESEQERMHKAFMSGRMNLQDFADQLDMVSKMGSLTQIAKFMPGMGGMGLSQEQLQKGEVEAKRFRAIISSMTPKERFQPALLNGVRKARIAQGSGTQVADVNLLLQRFEESQQFAKLFKKFSRNGKGFFG